MTSRKDARHALNAALESAGLDRRMPGADPPYIATFAAAGDADHVVAGKVVAGIRIVVVGGRWDSEQAADDVDDITAAVLTALRNLNGWQLGAISGTVVTELAGGRYLTQDIQTATLVDV